MKINSVYISSFGKIKNLKLDLNNSFNVIYGENENGKSTIMAFIKMMFYGSDRGSAQISKNIRKKYTPWDGSQMAGSIDFDHEGKLYRLEREFKASNSTDKVTLCDLDMGTRQNVGADIGAKFFGLSSAAFERSIFIGQLGFPESDEQAAGEINSKLSNIVLTGDEGVSFEAVYKRLEKAKLSLMSKSGRVGEYDKNLKLYNELATRLELAKTAEKDFQTKKADFAKMEAEIALLQKNAAALKEKIDAEQDVRNAEKLKNYLALKAQLDKTNEHLKLSDGTLIDEMYLRKLQFCISKVNAAKSKVEAKQGEISTLKKSLEIGLNPPENATQDTADKLSYEIEGLNKKRVASENKHKIIEKEITESKNQSVQKSQKGLNINLAIVALICAAGAVFSAVSLAFALLAVAVVLLITDVTAFFTIKALRNKKATAFELKFKEALAKEQAIKDEIARIISDINSKKASLEVVKTALQSSAAVVEKQKEMLESGLFELQELEKAKETEAEDLFKLFSLYKPANNIDEILSYIDEISEKANTQKEIKQQLNFISKDLGGISYEAAEQKLKEIDNTYSVNENFDDLKKQYEETAKEIVELKSKAAASVAESKALLALAENSKELQAQMEELKQKLLEQKKFCDTADIAMEVLTQSFAEIRRSYGSVLENKAAEIFSGLTANKYNNVSISKTFIKISVDEFKNMVAMLFAKINPRHTPALPYCLNTDATRAQSEYDPTTDAIL